MFISYSKTFRKQYDKANGKIQKAFDKRIQLFLEDPQNPQLHHHPLKGKFSGLRSINITGDWRALYSEKEDKQGTYIIFELLGTHSQLYR